MPEYLDPERVEQVHSVLQSHETEYLLEIWRTGDPGEWSPEAFEAIRQILKERLGEEMPRTDSPAEKLARARTMLEQAERDLEQDQFEAALAECDAALGLAPQLAAAHNCRGLILDGLEKPEAAILAYQEAVRLDPDFTEARENLQEAEREWAEGAGAGVPLSDDVASADFPLLNTMASAGVPFLDDMASAEAVAEYFCSECGAPVAETDKTCPACGVNVEEIEEAGTSFDVEAKLDQATQFADAGQWAKAILAYRIVLKVRPADPDVYNDLGTALDQAGAKLDAEEAYQKAIALAPRHAWAHLNLGLMYQEQGRTFEAIEAYRQCLENSEDPSARSEARLKWNALTGGVWPE